MVAGTAQQLEHHESDLSLNMTRGVCSVGIEP